MERLSYEIEFCNKELVNTLFNKKDFLFKFFRSERQADSVGPFRRCHLIIEGIISQILFCFHHIVDIL